MVMGMVVFRGGELMKIANTDFAATKIGNSELTFIFETVAIYQYLFRCWPHVHTR